jgi:hypothetical protein
MKVFSEKSYLSLPELLDNERSLTNSVYPHCVATLKEKPINVHMRWFASVAKIKIFLWF